MEIPQSQGIRLVSFNINGFRTLFHYTPWTKLRKLSAMFAYLQADIITLQELKVAPRDVDHTMGRVDGYLSFITVPHVKKGYSGVSVHVRIPQDDDPWHVKQSLTVIRAEEGITGVLTSHETKLPYRDSENAIGGYPRLEGDVSSRIDSEGRCVVVELANNTVVISVYCPANSMGTEEGDQFRVQFIDALFTRVRNLEAMGKHVVLMGDINISRDLIDSAETMRVMFQENALDRPGIQTFEQANWEQCISFTKSTLPRLMLNELLIDSICTEETEKPRIMIDTLRHAQGRKMALYTVWNTMTNSRPSNFGSRIDLILVTKELASCTKQADIWPALMGSDHCPIFADFETETLCDQGKVLVNYNVPRLEAKYVYKLSSGDIGMMFAMAKKRTPSTTPTPTPAVAKDTATTVMKNKVAKPATRNAKKQKMGSITQFFKAKNAINPTVVEESKPEYQSSQSSQLRLTTGGKFSLNETIPQCKHQCECVLKTALTKENKGRKFWTCCKPKGDISQGEDEISCDFFQWK